jgi:hypothetical protein
MALVRTVIRPSYRLFKALAAMSSDRARVEGSVGVELVDAIEEKKRD